MRTTSGGNARPLRSFIAGVARVALGFFETAAGGGALDDETVDAGFVAAALGSLAAPCLEADFTGRATSSSYPHRSHCHEGNTSLGSPAL
jgi:hypothetical protein